MDCDVDFVLLKRINGLKNFCHTLLFCDVELLLLLKTAKSAKGNNTTKETFVVMAQILTIYLAGCDLLWMKESFESHRSLMNDPIVNQL